MKITYTMQNSFINILRNPGFFIMNGLFSMTYTFFLALIGRFCLVLIKAITIEKNLTAAIESSSVPSVNTDGELIQLLSLLKTGCFILLAVLMIVGLFYYFTAFIKNFLLRKKDFSVEKYLGADDYSIAAAFTAEAAIPVLIFHLVGAIFAKIVYNFLTTAPSQHLEIYFTEPISGGLIIDLPIFILLLVLFMRLFFLIKKKLSSI